MIILTGGALGDEGHCGLMTYNVWQPSWCVCGAGRGEGDRGDSEITE